MKDMLNQELKVNDVVVYVYLNDNGKTSTILGKVTGFNKKGCKIDTKKGQYNVKNVIRLQKQNLLQLFMQKIKI